METIQVFFTQWVASLADLIPLGFAFGAGMVSAVNPCGFAMLPAYLGLFLGGRELATAPSGVVAQASDSSTTVNVSNQAARAVLIAVVVTAGFVLLFGGVGILISAGGQLIVKLMPWIALGIGGALVVLGVAILRGRHLAAGFATRIADHMGDPREVSLKGYLVFGIAYATASLSCTLPIFLTVVGASVAVSGFFAAALQFVSYALGMGLIILLLTVSMAVFKGVVVGGLRAALPHVERVSAILLVVAGSYIVYYWLFKGRLIDTFM